MHRFFFFGFFLGFFFTDRLAVAGRYLHRVPRTMGEAARKSIEIPSIIVAKAMENGGIGVQKYSHGYPIQGVSRATCKQRAVVGNFRLTACLNHESHHGVYCYGRLARLGDALTLAR